MILSSTLLLGLLGSVISMVAIQKYKIKIDVITFFFLLFNFAIVGTMSIFFSNGIPTYITQSYLVITSVILAWQLSQFNDWTAWCLLVMLALYDLCAVLTPCGPLKALINLMSKDGAPMLPGLLYEAQLPEGVERRSNRNNHSTGANSNTGNTNTNVSANNANGTRRTNESSRNGGNHVHNSNTTNDHSHNVNGSGAAAKRTKRNHTSNKEQMNHVPSSLKKRRENSNNHGDQQYDHGQRSRRNMNNNSNSNTINGIESQTHSQNPDTATLPLAIACIYKLHILSPPEYSTQHNMMVDGNGGTGGGQRRTRSQYNEQQLSSDVLVQFPRNGGYIHVDRPVIESPPQESSSSLGRFFNRNKRNYDVEAAEEEQRRNTRYIVYNRNGIIKRVLTMDPKTGRVFEEVEGDGEGGGALSSNSIKLGLVSIVLCCLVLCVNASFILHLFFLDIYETHPFLKILYTINNHNNHKRVTLFSIVYWYQRQHNTVSQHLHHVYL